MATRRKSSNTTQPRGMFSGIVIGLILGLAAAVAVALYVTKAPKPFMDKSDSAHIRLPDLQQALDPNSSLYSAAPTLEGPLFEGKLAQDPLGTLSPSASGSTPSPAVPATPDTLGNLIAQLPNPHTSASSKATAPTTAAPKAAAPQLAAAPTTYYLQAGAFRSFNDAEAMRARILLLGMDASLQSAPYENGTINRVRVGPFTGLDDMNQARSVLGREKIETSVVRP